MHQCTWACVLGVTVIITCQLGKAMVPRYLVTHFYRYFMKVLGVCVCVCVFLEEINI